MPSWILFLIALNTWGFCSESIPVQKVATKARQTPVTSGILGTVWWVSGNQMPSPDGKNQARKGVKRKIGVFRVCTEQQVEKAESSGFYTRIKTRRIRSVWTDARGRFHIKLPPGRYSLFVWEKGMWYANSFGENDEINPVEVAAGKTTEIELMVNYLAAY